MFGDIQIPDANGVLHCFSLRFTCLLKKIIVDGVCVIYLYKFHSHRYDISSFFYKTKYIYYRECITTKKELYDVIQKLLKENL